MELDGISYLWHFQTQVRKQKYYLIFTKLENLWRNINAFFSISKKKLSENVWLCKNIKFTFILKCSIRLSILYLWFVWKIYSLVGNKKRGKINRLFVKLFKVWRTTHVKRDCKICRTRGLGCVNKNNTFSPEKVWWGNWSYTFFKTNTKHFIKYIETNTFHKNNIPCGWEF